MTQTRKLARGDAGSVLRRSLSRASAAPAKSCVLPHPPARRFLDPPELPGPSRAIPVTTMDAIGCGDRTPATAAWYWELSAIDPVAASFRIACKKEEIL